MTEALDLLTICPIVSDDPSVPSEDRIIFTQPGMRFAQAQALIHSLSKDRLFATQTDRERERIDRGEFDMVIHDPERETCRLFEVKHTAERNYGKVLSRMVLYRGKPMTCKEGVEYCNVAAFLRGTKAAPPGNDCMGTCRNLGGEVCPKSCK